MEKNWKIIITKYLNLLYVHLKKLKKNPNKVINKKNKIFKIKNK